MLLLSDEQVLKDPLLAPFAIRVLHVRPTVFLLFPTLFLFSAKANLTILSYMFLAFALSLSYLGLFYLLRVLRGLTRNQFPAGTDSGWPSSIIPAAFTLGFWGQYTFDINAWSQIAAVGPLVLYVAFAANSVAYACEQWAFG